MDGLDDQAQATLESIIDQLYTNDVVQVKHSSRDLILLGVTQALKHPSRPVIARKLVLRSGVSLTAIGWLQQALLESDNNNNIGELEVCSLQDTTALAKVLELCQACHITKLTLNSFLSRARGRHNMVSETIRTGLLRMDELTDNVEQEVDAAGTKDQADHAALGFYDVYDVLTGQGVNTIAQQRQDRLRISDDKTAPSNKVAAKVSCLEYLELRNYPIGVNGAQIFADFPVCTAGLQTLKLLDCDLESDSANYLAQIIRYSPKLQTFDLSHNRHFRSKLTREMTIKTIVRSGLQDNLSLLQLYLHGVDKDINRTRLDRHLDINRLLLAYLENRERMLYGIHPAIWCDLLGRVSVKPAALYFFLQQNITTIFA
jgi:hypothetical protein